jgi:hypothetical protein
MGDVMTSELRVNEVVVRCREGRTFQDRNPGRGSWEEERFCG